MTLQSTVYFTSGLGIPGELRLTGPTRSQSFTLNSVAAGFPNYFGYAYSYLDPTQGNIATVGNPTGALLFAGYLVNPKNHALYGNALNTLAPTLVLPDFSLAEILSMGTIVVYMSPTRVGTGAPRIGDKVIFNNAQGYLQAMDPTQTLPSGFSEGYATITELPPISFGSSASMLAVIAVNNIQNIG